jgi:phosphoglycerate kinase
MQTLTAHLIKDKKVLLRMDLDVAIEEGKVVEDMRLEAGLDSLDFCLEHASSVIVMGHIGRPEGEDIKYSVKPIVDWFEEKFSHVDLPEGKLHILENLRFEAGEEVCDPGFAHELASYGEVFVNEAFASYHKSASTTVLPTLMAHAAGFRFEKEVEVLKSVRENPERPFVAIMGGAKVEDKLPAVLAMAKIADTVLVGGKIAQLMRDQGTTLPDHVVLADLTEDGFDITEETVERWKPIITGAKLVVWNGPLGKVEDEKNGQSLNVAQAIIAAQAKSILGGGDSIAFLGKNNLLDHFTFVSTGGGAMLEFLIKGTLETIEALK